MDSLVKIINDLEFALSPELKEREILDSFNILQNAQDALMLKGVECKYMMAALKETLIRNWGNAQPCRQQNVQKPVYVFEFDGVIKIGIGKNPDRRMRAVESASGRTAQRKYFTDALSNARNIESNAHKHFSDYRLRGEFFNVPFETAVEYVKQMAGIQNNLPEVQGQSGAICKAGLYKAKTIECITPPPANWRE